MRTEAGDTLYSEKTKEILERQTPIAIEIVQRVKTALANRGYVMEQSDEWDRYLVSTGKEAITLSDGTIILHSRVSASGFFEELIHYGQIKSGRAKYGDIENILLMEIEAKEKLISNQRAYGVTNYEIEIITESLEIYRVKLEELRKGGVWNVSNDS